METWELTETFFVNDESCVFTFDGRTLQWRDKVVSVSDILTIDFLHSGNCCAEKRSKPLFRKLPQTCDGHDGIILRYAESQKKNRLRLVSVKIRGEEQELMRWLTVLRCSLNETKKSRPQTFLVFINPFSGRQNGVDVYMRKVKPIFDAADRAATIVVTKSKSDFGRVISSGIDGYDAILAVGGDGTVSEIVNSLIMEKLPQETEEEVDVPRIDIPIGIIPCGSTDCVAYTLNGTRDAETNALHAVLGSTRNFDVCRAVSETGATRFFVSVFTYGYLSDLIKESEKFRWMGPIRYNYAGLLTLLRSKEYYGQIDMTGTQLGRKSVREIDKAGMQLKKWDKDEKAVDKVQNVVRKKSRSLSLSLLPIVPTVEPGSEFMEIASVCRPKKHGDAECDEPEATCEESMPPETTEEYSLRGRYFLIACANISCSSELTPNGIAPNCVPDDGNMNVVLFQPDSLCDLYKMYARLTSRDSSHPITELPFIKIYRTKRVKISVKQKNPEERNSANCDGELFHESVVCIKLHESVVRFFGRKDKSNV